MCLWENLRGKDIRSLCQVNVHCSVKYIGGCHLLFTMNRVNLTVQSICMLHVSVQVVRCNLRLLPWAFKSENKSNPGHIWFSIACTSTSVLSIISIIASYDSRKTAFVDLKENATVGITQFKVNSKNQQKNNNKLLTATARCFCCK